MKRKYISLLLGSLLLLSFAPNFLLAQDKPLVEIKVIPGATALSFMYETEVGKSVEINWGDGTSDLLSGEGLQVATHTFEFTSGGAPEGTTVTLDATNLLALEEPKNIANIAGWGELNAPKLERFIFAKPRISMMSFSPTLDFSKCPQLKTLKLHDVNQIILSRPSLLEELEVKGAWNSSEPDLFLSGMLDLADCEKLSTLTLTTQKELKAVDLTNCNSLKTINVRNCPKLSQLIGIKSLTNSLEKCNLRANALTFDQLPIWTSKLKETKTAYAQGRNLPLAEELVNNNVVNLSFIAKVEASDGKQHLSTISSVLYNGLPLNPSSYSFSETGILTFHKTAFLQGEDNEQVELASMDVRIFPTNSYYPNYGTDDYDPSFAVTLSNPFLHSVDKYAVSYKAGEGGSLYAHIVDNSSTPLESGQELESGTEIRLKAKPNRNYEVDQWLVNGEIVAATGANNEELSIRILKETSIEVTFKKKITFYSVTFSTDGNGSLTAENSTDQKAINSGDAVAQGTIVTFRATPHEGYEVASWEVNGIESPILGETLTETINEHLRVKVSFKTSYKTLSYSCNEIGGELSAFIEGTFKKVSSNQAIPEGTKIRLVASPKPNWRVNSWQINEQRLGESENLLEYVVTMDQDYTIYVLFEAYTSVETIKDSARNLILSDKSLLVNGYEESEIVSVYTPSGSLLLRRTVGDGKITFSTPLAQTTLIVTIGKDTFLLLSNP